MKSTASSRKTIPTLMQTVSMKDSTYLSHPKLKSHNLKGRLNSSEAQNHRTNSTKCWMKYRGNNNSTSVLCLEKSNLSANCRCPQGAKSEQRSVRSTAESLKKSRSTSSPFSLPLRFLTLIKHIPPCLPHLFLTERSWFLSTSRANLSSLLSLREQLCCCLLAW